jgi:hypothetical protein
LLQGSDYRKITQYWTQNASQEDFIMLITT